jgi:hypothetical protein
LNQTEFFFFFARWNVLQVERVERTKENSETSPTSKQNRRREMQQPQGVDAGSNYNSKMGQKTIVRVRANAKAVERQEKVSPPAPHPPPHPPPSEG